MKKYSYLLFGIFLLGAFGLGYYIQELKTTAPPKNLEGLMKNPRIFNMHEHFQGLKQAPKFLSMMSKVGIKKTLIVGSPTATIFTGRSGFENQDHYNDEAVKIIKRFPDKFMFFPTIDWADPNKLERLKHYIEQGGQGLKLYNGHSFFDEDIPMDEPSMMEVYAYCEANNLPILYHVNINKKKFREPFYRILEEFPNLKIICPHFCLSSLKLGRLDSLLEKYPNLYIDISFGIVKYLSKGLERISMNPEEFRAVMTKHQDRFMYGTDMVVTNARYKTPDWMANVALAYRKMLEFEKYEFSEMPYRTLRGLALDKPVLEKIYFRNIERLMAEAQKKK